MFIRIQLPFLDVRPFMIRNDAFDEFDKVFFYPAKFEIGDETPTYYRLFGGNTQNLYSRRIYSIDDNIYRAKHSVRLLYPCPIKNFRNDLEHTSLYVLKNIAYLGIAYKYKPDVLTYDQFIANMKRLIQQPFYRYSEKEINLLQLRTQVKDNYFYATTHLNFLHTLDANQKKQIKSMIKMGQTILYVVLQRGEVFGIPSEARVFSYDDGRIVFSNLQIKVQNVVIDVWLIEYQGCNVTKEVWDTVEKMSKLAHSQMSIRLFLSWQYHCKMEYLNTNHVKEYIDDMVKMIQKQKEYISVRKENHTLYEKVIQASYLLNEEHMATAMLKLQELKKSLSNEKKVMTPILPQERQIQQGRITGELQMTEIISDIRKVSKDGSRKHLLHVLWKSKEK